MGRKFFMKRTIRKYYRDTYPVRYGIVKTPTQERWDTRYWGILYTLDENGDKIVRPFAIKKLKKVVFL